MYDILDSDTLWMDPRWLGAFGNFDRTAHIADLYGSYKITDLFGFFATFAMR